MISGALLLSDSREYTYKSFLTKRISKVFLPLLGWSIIYYFYFVGQERFVFSIPDFIEKFSSNEISNHFWFIYMLLGLYLITPLLKILVRNASKRDVKYFLILWFYISILSRLMNFYFGFSFNIELNFVTNFVGYYLLGYYLITNEINTKWRILIYTSGIAGVLATFIFTYTLTIEADGAFRAFWYDYHSITVFTASMGLFLLLKYSKASTLATTHFLPKIINDTSFGIYLVHILVMDFLAKKLSFIWLNLNAFIEIPYKVLLTVAVSVLIVKLLKILPVLNKLVP